MEGDEAKVEKAEAMGHCEIQFKFPKANVIICDLQYVPVVGIKAEFTYSLLVLFINVLVQLRSYSILISML